MFILPQFPLGQKKSKVFVDPQTVIDLKMNLNLNICNLKLHFEP